MHVLDGISGFASALTGICWRVETSFLLPPKCQLPTALHLLGPYLIGAVKVSYVIGLQMFHSLGAWVIFLDYKIASDPLWKCQINDKTSKSCLIHEVNFESGGSVVGVMLGRSRGWGFNSPRMLLVTSKPSCSQPIYSRKVFPISPNSLLVTAANVAPTSLSGFLARNHGASSVTDNTCRTFTSLTTSYVSTKTPFVLFIRLFRAGWTALRPHTASNGTTSTSKSSAGLGNGCGRCCTCGLYSIV